MKYRIGAPRISPHFGHTCEIVPLKAASWPRPRKVDRMGKSLVACECGVKVVLPCRNLRRLP
jgi:hypothetical protein